MSDKILAAFSAAIDQGALGAQVINNVRHAAVAHNIFDAAVAKAMAATGEDLSDARLKPVSDDEALTRVVTLGRGLNENQRFDRVKRAGGEAIYTFNVRSSDAVEAKWTPAGELRYGRQPGQAGQINVFKLPRDVGLAVTANWNYYRDHLLTPDISRFLASVMKEAKALSLRDSGGVWFVPRAGLAHASAGIDVVRDVLTTSSLGIINVADDGPTGEHRAVVATAAADEFTAALAEAKAALLEYTEASVAAAEPNATTRGPRVGTAVARLADLRALVDKVKLYADLLSVKQDDVLQTAGKLEKFWHEMLGL